MSNYIVETVEYKGHTIKIKPYEYGESPREWDNLGQMVCFSRNYNLGDEHHWENHEVFERAMGIYVPVDEDDEYDPECEMHQEERTPAVILPLYLYDHSGITMNTTGFHCQWDSGQVGWIMATKEDVIKEFGDLSDETLDKVRKILVSEVEIYDKYLRGEVYGFVVEKDGEETDSCWGYYSVEEAIEAAKENI